MPIDDNKVAGFSFNHADQIDELFITFPNSQDIKDNFDSRAEELRVKYNTLIDFLQTITDGDSGADAIGATAIPGVTGDTVQTILEGLKVAIDSVVLESLPDNSITSTKYQDQSITNQKIALNTISGDRILSQTIGTVNIILGAITENLIADNAISSLKIIASAIQSIHLSPLCVGSAALQNNIINTIHLVNECVDASKLAPNSVTNTKIASGAVSSTKILDSAVTNLKLDPLTVNFPERSKILIDLLAQMDKTDDILPALNRFWDNYDNLNFNAQLEIDNFFTNTTAAYGIGVNTVSVLSTTGLDAKEEITLQDDLGKEYLIVQSTTPTTVTFTTNTTKAYKINAMLYRSYYLFDSTDPPGIRMPTWDNAGTGWGAQIVRPSGLGATNMSHVIDQTPSGVWVAIGMEQAPYFRVYPYNETTGAFGTEVTQTITFGGSVHGIAFHPTGKWVAISYSSSPYFTLYRWNDVTGKLVTAEIQPYHGLPTKGNKVSWSQDGKMLFLSCDSPGPTTAAIYNFDFDISKGYGSLSNEFLPRGQVTLYTNTTSGGAFTKNQKYVVVGSERPNLGLLSYRVLQDANMFGDWVSADTGLTWGRTPQLTSDERWVAISSVNTPFYRIYPYDSDNGKIAPNGESSLSLPSPLPGISYGCAWSRDDKAIIFGCDTTPYVKAYRFDPVAGSATSTYANPAVLPNLTAPNNINHIRFSNNGKFVFLCQGQPDGFNEYAFSSKVSSELYEVDIRYKILPNASISKLYAWGYCTRDANFGVSATLSCVGTTDNENFLAMTRIVTPTPDGLINENAYTSGVLSGTKVTLRLRLGKVVSGVNEKFYKLLGYMY